MSSRRSRIAVRGALLVAALGVLAGAVSVAAGWIDRTPLHLVTFFLCVLTGPLTLVCLWLVRGSASITGIPLETLAFAVAALVATPLHPLFQQRWAAVATIVGLSFWLLCALIVAGAPA